MTINLQEIRNDHKKLNKTNGNRHAVIVRTEYLPKKMNFGVQYWTNQMILEKIQTNTDNTISTFIEKL